jgi:diadenosine tetraphosphate (Ap4A) HIT family hydrolase
VFESDTVLAFLDVNPLSKGHALVIPKQVCVQKLHQLPDATLRELLPVVKKVAMALDSDLDYNILQNNGRAAYQSVDHVHFHIIPKVPKGDLKPATTQLVPEQLVNADMQGLGLNWKVLQIDKEQTAKLAKDIAVKIEAMYAAEAAGEKL